MRGRLSGLNGWDWDGMVMIGRRSSKSTLSANNSCVGSAFGDISGFYARRYGGAPF